MTKKNPIIYIRDDNGHAWYFDNGKIECVLHDLDETMTPEERKESGFYCNSLEEGVAILNENGFITGYEYNDNESEEYFDLKAHVEGW